MLDRLTGNVDEDEEDEAGGEVKMEESKKEGKAEEKKDKDV